MLWVLVERLHRTMKLALMFHGDETWSDNLPAVLLGLRCHDLKDLGATPTGLVSGVRSYDSDDALEAECPSKCHVMFDL
jgi:hypothetical protein